MIVPKAPGQVAFLQELIRVVWGLAKEGHAVILGRGANWFLNQEFGLRLRVVADREERAERLAKRENNPALAITPWVWFRYGLPAMLTTLIVSSIVFYFYFDFFAAPIPTTGGIGAAGH